MLSRRLTILVLSFPLRLLRYQSRSSDIWMFSRYRLLNLLQHLREEVNFVPFFGNFYVKLLWFFLDFSSKHLSIASWKLLNFVSAVPCVSVTKGPLQHEAFITELSVLQKSWAGSWIRRKIHRSSTVVFSGYSCDFACTQPGNFSKRSATFELSVTFQRNIIFLSIALGLGETIFVPPLHSLLLRQLLQLTDIWIVIAFHCFYLQSFDKKTGLSLLWSEFKKFKCLHLLVLLPWAAKATRKCCFWKSYSLMCSHRLSSIKLESCITEDQQRKSLLVYRSHCTAWILLSRCSNQKNNFFLNRTQDLVWVHMMKMSRFH